MLRNVTDIWRSGHAHLQRKRSFATLWWIMMAVSSGKGTGFGLTVNRCSAAGVLAVPSILGGRASSILSINSYICICTFCGIEKSRAIPRKSWTHPQVTVRGPSCPISSQRKPITSSTAVGSVCEISGH